ncbi:MAG: mechanosensitive ion channel family protein [Roseibacillus sp.]
MIFAQTPPPTNPAATELVAKTAQTIQGSGEQITDPPPGFSLNYIFEKLREAFIEMADGAISALPNLVIAGVLLFVGLIAAKVIRAVLTSTFKKINLDSAFDKMGLTEIFSKIGLKAGPSSAIPKLLYWLILLAFIKVAADKAGIEDISTLLDQIMAFLPKVLTASIILLVGFIVADLIQNAAFRSLDNIGLEYAGSLSRILFGFIFILVLTVAFAQLGIETELLNSSVKIVLAGLALALAIALGLGLKTLAGHIVAGVYARDLYKIGTEIHYDDLPAKVSGVGPLTTKLTRDDGTFVIIPNTIMVNEVIRGRTEN